MCTLFIQTNYLQLKQRKGNERVEEMEGRTGHGVHQVSGIMFDGNHDSTITFAAILLFLT